MKPCTLHAATVQSSMSQSDCLLGCTFKGDSNLISSVYIRDWFNSLPNAPIPAVFSVGTFPLMISACLRSGHQRHKMKVENADLLPSKLINYTIKHLQNTTNHHKKSSSPSTTMSGHVMLLHGGLFVWCVPASVLGSHNGWMDLFAVLTCPAAPPGFCDIFIFLNRSGAKVLLFL